ENSASESDENEQFIQCSCFVPAPSPYSYMRHPASTMGRYPVQRHKFPARASLMSRRDGLSADLYNANSDITKPGVQKPHCEPWQSTSACWTGCSAPLSPRRLSTVISSLPSSVGTN